MVAKKKKYRIEIDLAEKGEFLWRALHRNGKSVAIGGETYKRKTDARRAFSNLINGFVAGDYEVVDLTAKKK